MNFILFADDTNILCEDEDYATLSNNVDNELKLLNKWFAINKLSLNVTKTKYMVFGNKCIGNNRKIFINMQEIEKIDKIKFLGGNVDSKLSLKFHIEQVVTKISKSISLI